MPGLGTEEECVVEVKDNKFGSWLSELLHLITSNEWQFTNYFLTSFNDALVHMVENKSETWKRVYTSHNSQDTSKSIPDKDTSVYVNVLAEIFWRSFWAWWDGGMVTWSYVRVEEGPRGLLSLLLWCQLTSVSCSGAAPLRQWAVWALWHSVQPVGVSLTDRDIWDFSMKRVQKTLIFCRNIGQVT